MRDKFEAAYAQLNAKQKLAVDTIDGPVLVVAGPGTGKTQLLSLRVANILKRTDTEPSNVLCLTFTNFAATNMRERLTELVGPDAHHVVVRTFHSFAAEVMNLYPDYFWNGARLSIAPEAVILEVIQTILTHLPLSSPLAVKFAGNYTALSDVKEALKLTKEAGLTPAKLKAMLAVNEAYLDLIEKPFIDILAPALSYKKLKGLLNAVEALPDQNIDDTVAPLNSLSTVLKLSLQKAIDDDLSTGRAANTSTWKKRWVQSVNGQKGMFDERRRNEWWREVAVVYESYREALHERGYYDYSDMIIEVITQLEQHPELLASVQERFQYVLIDEFQDTNAAQLRLAHLVSTHFSNAGKPNLMAVGDDDQSIFAFNGAELNNMLTFKRSYPGTRLIVLEDNYRSSQAILDTARGIIEQADDRLVLREANLTKNLRAVTSRNSKGIVEHVSYPTRDHQFLAIAQRLKQTWNSSAGQEIAVLARSHDSLRRLSAILNNMHIPVRYEQQTNLFDHEIVIQLCLLAETVEAIATGDDREVNYKLALLIRHPLWHLPPKILWKLAQENYPDAHWLESLLESKDEHLSAIGNWLVWLAQTASFEPLPVVLEYFIGLRAGEQLTSPLREHFLSIRPTTNLYLEALSATQLLTNLANELARTKSANLTDFVRFIQLNREVHQQVTDESWFVTGTEAVQLMTVHKAKGSEFDIVFVLDAIESNWQPNRVGRKAPANLPLQPYGEQYDDYVRLLYVASTRAKHSLIISSYCVNEQGRELLATPLITTVLETRIVKSNELFEPVTVLETALTWPRLESADEKTLLQPKLDTYSLSATALLQFLNITNSGPSQFLERQLLHVPQGRTVHMAYGTAMHVALQRAQQLVNAEAFTLTAVIISYETALREQQLPKTDCDRYLPHGRDILNHLFADLHFTLPKNGEPEVGLSQVKIGNARLSGKLDHVMLKGKKLLISDYKTGKPLTNFETRDQTKVLKAWQHRTQLLFYILLAQHSGRYQDVSDFSAQMLYVEAELQRELSLELHSDTTELDRMKKLIAAVWKHVVELDFPDTSKYPKTIDGILAFENDLISGEI